MPISAYSPIKINLTLRILNKRADGYHDLFSLFWRKDASERLTILDNCAEITGDIIDVAGAVIDGENILTRVINAARKKNAVIPPLKILLEKVFPAGSGIGAGSGNAAALLDLLKETSGLRFTEEETAGFGADVAFLASGCRMAEASGVGEILKPVSSGFDARWLLVFPKWSSNTAEAYAKLDAARKGRGYEAPSAGSLRDEARAVLKQLESGACAGRLPNDFYGVSADAHPEYAEAERTARGMSASAWGLCGSGSAFFALFKAADKAEEAASVFRKKNWVSKTYCDME